VQNASANINVSPAADASTVSLVVPLLNEMALLPTLTAHLDSVGADQTVLVDGGSTDGSVEWLREHWQGGASDRCLLQAPAGRAIQMNVGAGQCHGDMILFLHADTRLPDGVRSEIITARNRQRLWGRFDLRFPPKASGAWLMRMIALFINLRSRLSGIATGDQAMFVDRQLFELTNGFPAIALMEDVAMSKRLKKYCMPHCSRLKVETSARRWEQNGVIKTVLMMWLLRFAYFIGISTDSLSRVYRDTR